MNLTSLFSALFTTKTESILDARGNVMTVLDKDGKLDVLPLLHYVRRSRQMKVTVLTKKNIVGRKVFQDSVKKAMEFNGFTEREVCDGANVAGWVQVDEQTTMLDVIASILPHLFTGTIPSMLPIKEFYEGLIARANEANEPNDMDPEPETETNDIDPEPETETNDNQVPEA